jgi:3-deoxy-D-manno-octulosonic-acid transferase
VKQLLRFPYALAGRLTDGLVRVVPAGNSKFRRGLSRRRGLVERYQQWGASSRDTKRPLVWFHAPSVGEGLQAQPVIDLLRARRPDVQIAYTFYSPSAEQFATTVQADFSDYLPFDTVEHSVAVLSALRPSALVFSKLDIWPVLTESAASSGVAVGVISASLPKSSRRRGALARAFLDDAYSLLDRVGAIDESDAERLREQGVRGDRVNVTGDTRFDQVWARAQRTSSPLVLRLLSSRPTLVAGSTWPSDEEHLLDAWIRIRDKIPDARLVIAPHETTDRHLRSIERWAGSHRLGLARVDASEAHDSDVILVDRHGVLGDLYALADTAYVGGGFHSAGLHSVLEPAAFGAPVLFGPKNEKSPEAAKLVEAGGGAVVTGVPDLTIRLGYWLGSVTARDAAGSAARTMVQQGLGAAVRSLEVVTALLAR